MSREVMKLALEALEGLFGTAEQFEGGGVAVWRLGGSAEPKQAITAIKEALAQPEQEPVAWMYDWEAEGATVTNSLTSDYDEAHCSTMGCTNILPLYTTPPQRTWVGLTPSEIEAVMRQWDYEAGKGGGLKKLIAITEAKLKEKNT